MIKIDNLKERLNKTTLPVVENVYTGGYSFNVVYSENNGKRIAFSKALSAKLALEDEIELFPIPDENVLVVSKNLPDNRSIKCKLSGKDKKIGYNSSAVKLIIDSFNLNFDSSTSKSFSNIKIDELDGVSIAQIEIREKNLVTK